MKTLNLLEDKDTTTEKQHWDRDESWYLNYNGEWAEDELDIHNWKKVVELPRISKDKYRYFLAQDIQNYISIRRVLK